ncbi:MAG: cytochrome C [Rudanella sp.]|nr:cytochrome C [Rudanella sp.]
MSKTQQTVRLFMDDSPTPFAEYAPPVKIDLNTTRLVDGDHVMKVVARSSDGKDGVRFIPFTVRNGPSISVIGLDEGDTVSDIIPVTVSAYGSERTDSFVIEASETPKPIPFWVWAVLIGFVGWGAWYLISYLA